MSKKTMIKEIEEKDNKDLLMSLKSNEKAKKILFKATNLSNNLSKLVPEMGIAVNEIIKEIDKRQDIKIKGEIDFSFLKEHLYTLASYDKSKKDRAFEMAVIRGVKLGIKMNSQPNVFKVEDNEILIMSKVAVPFKTEDLPGVKGGKTKDTARNLNAISSEFLTELNKVYNSAMKKDNAKLLSMVTEKTIENFGNILALLQDNIIRKQWSTASELQATNVDGNVKKTA